MVENEIIWMNQDVFVNGFQSKILKDFNPFDKASCELVDLCDTIADELDDVFEYGVNWRVRLSMMEWNSN